MNYKELAEQALDYIVNSADGASPDHRAYCGRASENGLYRDPTLPGPYRIMCDAAGGKGRKGVQNCGSPGGYLCLAGRGKDRPALCKPK